MTIRGVQACHAGHSSLHGRKMAYYGISGMYAAGLPCAEGVSSNVETIAIFGTGGPG